MLTKDEMALHTGGDKPRQMLLNEDQRRKLEEHGHPEAWFVCTIKSRCTIECDHCDQVLLILTEDPEVCAQPHPHKLGVDDDND